LGNILWVILQRRIVAGSGAQISTLKFQMGAGHRLFLTAPQRLMVVSDRL
jgi:hypothetical protein